MQVKCLSVGPLQANCYIVINAESNTLLIIDPGHDQDYILGKIRKNGGKPNSILLTHGHADHISAATAISKELSIPVYLHENDCTWAFSEHNTIDGLYAPQAKPSLLTFLEGQSVQCNFEDLTCNAILTPGHSPGSVCYYFKKDNILFSGDTLFSGSIGRTDLDLGSPNEMKESLEKLAKLPGCIRVYPGHGPSTTIEQEKQNNFFFRNLRQR